MRMTRAVRDAQRDAANAAKQCDTCGHPVYRHLELDRAAAEYKPLHFHCSHDGCDCIRVAA